MPKGTVDFFKAIGVARADGTQFGTQFATQFDEYYLCLLVGLDARRLGQVSDLVSTGEFIKDYPTSFQAQSTVIAGLLVDAELDRQLIGAVDRDAIQQEMLRLLDHNSATGLSSVGQGLLNQYAAGGFSIIRDQLPSPQSLPDLLRAYVHIWHPPDAAS